MSTYKSGGWVGQLPRSIHRHQSTKATANKRWQISITAAFASKIISDHKCYYWNDSDFDYLCNIVIHIFIGIDSAVPEIHKANKHRKTVDTHDPLNDEINAHGGGSLVRLNVF